MEVTEDDVGRGKVTADTVFFAGPIGAGRAVALEEVAAMVGG